MEALIEILPYKTESVIRKNMIFDLANNQLNNKLAISNMFRFVQQVEMLKLSMMKEYRLFIEYSQKNVIHMRRLAYLLKKHDLYKYDESSSNLQLSLNKSINFLVGIRALKSKAILNEKIDCNLLIKFSLPPSLIKKYFVAHYDTLQKNLNLIAK